MTGMHISICITMLLIRLEVVEVISRGFICKLREKLVPGAPVTRPSHLIDYRNEKSSMERYEVFAALRKGTYFNGK